MARVSFSQKAENSYRQDLNRAHLVAGLIGYALDINPECILEKKRSTHDIALARQIAMYLVYAGLGVSMMRIAVVFGRDRSTVAYACRRIEDKREDRAFDNWLDILEQGLVSIAALKRGRK